MPIVEISGVGKVELDDSFLQMSPEQQDATIKEIAASASQPRQQNIPAAPPQGPVPQAPMAEGAPPELAPPAPARTGGTTFDFDKMEAEYQAQKAQQKKVNRDPKSPDKTSFMGAAGMGALDGLSFGFDDEVLSGLATVIPGVGKKSIWDGSNPSEAFAANVKKYRDLKDAAWDEHTGAYIGGGLATALVPWGAASKLVSGGKGLIKAAKAADELGTVSNAARYGKAAKNGAIYGGIYGAGSDTGNPLDRIDGAAMGIGAGALGGVAGEAVIGTALRALPGNKATNFANREVGRNEYAAYDAEVVQDLAAATRDRAVTASDPKGRAALTAKTINNVEQRYFAEYKNVINAMPDVPEPIKLKLKAALSGKYAMTRDEINSLPNTVEGDAVAQAIIKVQRLRALTPELKRSTGWLLKAANVADFVPAVPGIVGRSMRGIARAAGDGEAARVNAADKLLAKERGYNKLADMVGPSGQKEADAALWAKANEVATKKESEAAQGEIEKIMSQTSKDVSKRFNVSKKDPDFANFQASMRPDAGELELANMAAQTKLKKQAASKLINSQDKKLSGFDDALNVPKPEVVEKPVTKRELSDFRKQLEDPTPDMRDITDPIPSERALASRVQSRNKALAKLESNASDWEAQLADPSTAPKPKADKPSKGPNAKDKIVDDNIASGIAGESGTHNAFTSRVEVSKDDLLRVLDKAEQDFPELASELNRIRFNYPTKDRTFGSAIIPRLKAIRDELGIAPQKASPKPAVAVDEAAQARLAQTATDDAPKLTGKAAAKEQELLARLDEIDPVVVQLADDIETGGGTRASEIPDVYTVDDATAKEAKAIREELRKLRQIDRPIQWEQGKNRYQALANGAIEDLNNDITIGSEALGAIKRIPEKIRDTFKTTDEATAYIEREVIPELEAAKASREEIKRITGYLYDIASQKPYATQEAYEAGTKANQRGRPRKQQD